MSRYPDGIIDQEKPIENQPGEREKNGRHVFAACRPCLEAMAGSLADSKRASSFKKSPEGCLKPAQSDESPSSTLEKETG